MERAAAVEAETCSVGGGRPSLSEPVAAATHSLNCWRIPLCRNAPSSNHRLIFSGTCSAVCQRTSCFVDAQGCSTALLAQRPPSLFSKSTDDLQAVVSHNWSVGRSRMWLALSLHWYFLSALVCGVLTAEVLCVPARWNGCPLRRRRPCRFRPPPRIWDQPTDIRPVWGCPTSAQADLGPARPIQVGSMWAQVEGGGGTHREKKRKTRGKTFGEKRKGVGQSTWSVVFVKKRRQPKARDVSTQARLMPALGFQRPVVLSTETRCRSKGGS